jgi:hypothetical protein
MTPQDHTRDNQCACDMKELRMLAWTYDKKGINIACDIMEQHTIDVAQQIQR